MSILRRIQNLFMPAKQPLTTQSEPSSTIGYFQRLKNTQMLCSECAFILGGVWQERRCCPQSFCVCDMCKIAKPCTGIFEWTFPSKSLIGHLTESGRIVNFSEYDTNTLIKKTD